MGYLNNTTVTVDAILTKKGRELLARGGNAFNITSFALADDEIDYDLWNQSHPLGDDKMGIVIENLPITEAVPDETQSMKYKLITLPEGTKAIPYIESSAATIGLTTNTTPGLSITLQTKIWNDTGINSKPESKCMVPGFVKVPKSILLADVFICTILSPGTDPMYPKSKTCNI